MPGRDEGAFEEQGRGRYHQRAHDSAASLQPSEVLQMFEACQSRCDTEWLSAVLLECQQLVLRAHLENLTKQPPLKRKAASPQPSASARWRSRPADSDHDPHSEYEDDLLQPTRKSARLTDPRHSSVHSQQQMTTGPHLLTNAPYNTLVAGIPAAPMPPQPPARQAQRHAEAVTLFATQRQASMQEASAAQVLRELQQGEACAMLPDGTTRRLKTVQAKATWPPEMAAIVAEEMMAADKVNRNVNFKYLRSKLGDSYTEKQIKTKIDTFRKQQRRNPALFASGDPNVVVGLASEQAHGRMASSGGGEDDLDDMEEVVDGGMEGGVEDPEGYIGEEYQLMHTMQAQDMGEGEVGLAGDEYAEDVQGVVAGAEAGSLVKQEVDVHGDVEGDGHVVQQAPSGNGAVPNGGAQVAPVQTRKVVISRIAIRKPAWSHPQDPQPAAQAHAPDSNNLKQRVNSLMAFPIPVRKGGGESAGAPKAAGNDLGDSVGDK